VHHSDIVVTAISLTPSWQQANLVSQFSQISWKIYPLLSALHYTPLCLFHPDCVQWLKSTALLMLFLSTSTPRVKKQDTETLACNFPKYHRFSQFFTERLTGKFATLIFKHPTKSLASFFLQYRPLQNKLNFYATLLTWQIYSCSFCTTALFKNQISANWVYCYFEM